VSLFANSEFPSTDHILVTVLYLLHFSQSQPHDDSIDAASVHWTIQIWKIPR
jgi:hypothetical protein